MALKTYKPYTKSNRGTILIDRSQLWKGKPYKPLTSINKSSRGRNNLGRITSRNTGGGHKQRYREVDFYRRKFDMIGDVERIEYDPNRSCHIMLEVAAGPESIFSAASVVLPFPHPASLPDQDWEDSTAFVAQAAASVPPCDDFYL